MPKATIKSKTGATITVEGTPEEVANILSAVENATLTGHAKGTAPRAKAAKKTEKKRESAADLIVSLREEGFFEKPKTLGEVAKALEERGFLYQLTSLSGIVLSLIKRRELRRTKKGGKWVYGK